VTEPRPDDERLSALLDGRLQGRERDELLAHLADDDDDYQRFVDSADILHELQDEDAREQAPTPEGATPPSMGSPARGWRRRTPRWIAIPAVLVGFAVFGILATRGRTTRIGEPVHLAASLEPARGPLPNANGARPWDAFRGPGAAVPQAAQAAQAGAMLVDLSLAAQQGDSAATRLWAEQLWHRFDQRAGPDTPLRRISAHPGQPYESLRPLLVRATERLEESLGREPLRLGAWTQAALLAAQWKYEPFFRSGETRETLRAAERVTAGDPPAGAALEAVRTALPAEGTDWATLQSAITKLQAEIAS
jgi:hypothetical protein